MIKSQKKKETESSVERREIVEQQHLSQSVLLQFGVVELN